MSLYCVTDTVLGNTSLEVTYYCGVSSLARISKGLVDNNSTRKTPESYCVVPISHPTQYVAVPCLYECTLSA